MLPRPITAPKGRPYRKLDAGQRHKIDALLTRSRVTNLSLVLILTCLALSIFLNLRHWLSTKTWLHVRHMYTTPISITETVSRMKDISQLDHLIIVPGHAVWTGSRTSDVLDENHWLLEPYQRGGGRVTAFVKHIQHGAELADDDENSLLVFSGGQTRPISPDTEATSYLSLALALNLLSSSTHRRTTTENYALDSFQNLLFSIARFHEVTGRYPKKLTVVGYEMKRRRFEELHREALRWPQSRWRYVGIDAEGEEDMKVAYAGERQNGYLPYSQDMYGCHDLLLSKRRSRNMSGRYHPYHSSAPEIWDLLEWCPDVAEGGRDVLFVGALPWDHW